MVGGSTNKLTVAGFDRADKKAITFNASKYSLVGNNSTGDNIFGKNKRFKITTSCYHYHQVCLLIRIHSQ